MATEEIKFYWEISLEDKENSDFLEFCKLGILVLEKGICEDGEKLQSKGALAQLYYRTNDLEKAKAL